MSLTVALREELAHIEDVGTARRLAEARAMVDLAGTLRVRGSASSSWTIWPVPRPSRWSSTTPMAPVCSAWISVRNCSDRRPEQQYRDIRAPGGDPRGWHGDAVRLQTQPSCHRL